MNRSDFEKLTKDQLIDLFLEKKDKNQAYSSRCCNNSNSSKTSKSRENILLKNQMFEDS